MPRKSASSTAEPSQTQFIPLEGDEDNLWDVVRILDERDNRYKVMWKGDDPATGKPWLPSWVYKTDCTDDLIQEWKERKKRLAERKRRQKSAGSKTRSSAGSSKLTKRSTSTSTTGITRRTRQSNANILQSPITTRSSDHAVNSHASPAVQHHPSPSPHKRRRTTRESVSEEADTNIAGPSRPRKKRKVEVEVVNKERQLSQDGQSGAKRRPRKSIEKTSWTNHTNDAGEEEDVEELPKVAEGLRTAAGKRRATREEVENPKHMDYTEQYGVPMDKVGPPRHTKRRQKNDTETVRRGHAPSERPSQSRSIDDRQVSTSKSAIGRTTSPTAATLRKVGPPTHRKAGMLSKSPAPPSATNSPHNVDGHHSETEGFSAEKGHSDRFPWKDSGASNAKHVPLSPRTRQFLAQEEEENTQEAEGLVLSGSRSPIAHNSPGPLNDSHGHRDNRILSDDWEGEEQPRPRAGPSKPPVQRGRQVARDIFSRDGIVPETQSTRAPDDLDEPPYDPTQNDLSVFQANPVTPKRSAGREGSGAGSVSSIVSKMKSRARAQRKELRPIGDLTPPDFRPYLVSEQDDEIEEFSSPEKGSHRKRRAPEPYTQETIEDAEFTQDVDRYVNWDGSLQPEGNAVARANGPDLSLGPDLLFAHEEESPRRAMESLLSKRREAVDHPSAYSSPVHLQEPPPTSTTQRADMDSESMELSCLNTQVVELTTALEEKDAKVEQLEDQVEELQAQLRELEDLGSKDRASLETELEMLRGASREKSEQISSLESQLVELQLQLTQITELENQRAQYESQVRELNESLEERTEQVSQLEEALIQLQTEIESMQDLNEKLTAELAQHEASHGSDVLEAQQAAAQQRLAALVEEQSSTRAKLSQAEEEARSLSARLGATNQEWERRMKYAEEDRDLYKKLYSEASTHAQRLAQENAALEERAQRAEGQAEQGVAMVRGTYAQQVQMLQSEVEQWKSTVKVLSDRDERTNDEVRRRAALEPALQEENARLRVEAQIARREADKLKEIVARMASAQVMPPNEFEGDDDDDAAPDYVPDPSEERDSSSSRSVEPSMSASGSSVGGDAYLYVCQHVSGIVMCNATFSSSQDVINHAYAAHYRELAGL